MFGWFLFSATVCDICDGMRWSIRLVRLGLGLELEMGRYRTRATVKARHKTMAKALKDFLDHLDTFGLLSWTYPRHNYYMLLLKHTNYVYSKSFLLDFLNQIDYY